MSGGVSVGEADYTKDSYRVQVNRFLENSNEARVNPLLLESF